MKVITREILPILPLAVCMFFAIIFAVFAARQTEAPILFLLLGISFGWCVAAGLQVAAIFHQIFTLLLR